MNKERHTTTFKQINDAYKFLHKWKRAKGLDDDDIQDIIIKYTRFYNPEMNDEAQLYKYIQYHNYKKYFAINQKHSGTTIHYQQYTTLAENERDISDWTDCLAVEDTTFEDKDDLEAIRETISNYLTLCTRKQQKVIRMHYMDEMTMTDIGKQLGMTRQNVSYLIDAGLNKIREYVK